MPSLDLAHLMWSVPLVCNKKAAFAHVRKSASDVNKYVNFQGARDGAYSTVFILRAIFRNNYMARTRKKSSCHIVNASLSSKYCFALNFNPATLLHRRC